MGDSTNVGVGYISEDSWLSLSILSKDLLLRRYSEVNGHLASILDADDGIEFVSKASIVGSFLVERLHGNGPRREIARLIFETSGQSIQYLAADGGHHIPESSLIAYFERPSAFAPPFGDGEKMDQWVYITVGSCLTLFQNHLRNASNQIIEASRKLTTDGRNQHD